MKKKDIIKFIFDHKASIGFGNYDVVFDWMKKDFKDRALARIIVYEIGQRLELEIPPQFFKESHKAQYNILKHELIHGRVSLKEDRVDYINSREEELMVNDITSFAEGLKNNE